MTRVLFVIPARGGSKGLIRKNIKALNGKPLIAWSIETVLEALKMVDGTVVVSTDDDAIAEIAKQYHAEVPFKRPNELALDTTASMEVMLHALNFYKNIGIEYDLIAMIEPTSPQREAKDLINAINLLLSTPNAESIVGICKAESAHPDFMVKLDQDFIIPYKTGEIEVKRRQDVDDLYFFEGSLYISKVESLVKRKSFFHEKTLGFVMPKWKAFEIDDIVDFIIVESLMKAKENGTIL